MSMKECILYIDDEQENLDSFQIAFWMYYDISIALNTQIAREILSQRNIKVIITDQRMPDENGLDFIKNIVSLYPDIVYMVLTGHSDIDVVLDALNNGSIYRFMMKPWEMQELKQSIDNAIENYNLRLKNKSLISELQEKNDALKKSEYKFRNIFNSSLDSISIIKPSNKILEANAITCTSSGYSRKELLSLNFLDLFPVNKQEEISMQLKKLSPEKEVFFEASFINKHGQNIYLDIIAKEIDYLGEKAIMIIARDISEKKELQQKMLKTAIFSEEKERTRIAQELHDGIGPLLSSIKLYTETYFSSTKPDLRILLQDQIIDSIDDTIDHVAAISYNLSPHILRNFGLKTAIEKFCNNIQKSSNILITKNIQIENRCTDEIEITFYRVVIELINNTLKHSNASQINIELLNNEGAISLNYSDNGIGYRVDEIMKESKGMGLLNIKNRIESLNGEISFNSVSLKSSDVIVKIQYA